MRFGQFIGQDDARLGLMLNAVDSRCGGLLLVGGKGTGKSTLVRLGRTVFPDETPFVEMPLNVTEESLLGGIDIEAALSGGQRVLQPGIISRANGGVVFVDDINLLSRELLALLMEPQSRGAELIEREGMSERRESRFVILATMNPEEGDLSPHLMDRIGLCAVMEVLNGRDERLAVMRLAGADPVFRVEADPETAGRIKAARALLPEVILSGEALDYLHQAAERNVSPGHRGDVFLYYAARAWAALRGDTEVDSGHIDRVANLVFSHRRLELRQEEQTATEPEQPHDHNQERDRDQDDRGEQPPPENGENKPDDQPSGEGERDSDSSPRESAGREEIMRVGAPFQLRRLSFPRDRMKRKAAGRRTRTRVRGRGGRHVRSLLDSPDRDIAIAATLRACAPFQKARGRRANLLIERDDLRFRQRERRMGHLVLFVVDGSGSMGAQRRMVETKGAIQSLLLDCYRKRDRVAMIVFRKERAELVLPPTSSVELAARRLAELPVGGKTPLAAGLLETHRLARRTAMRRPDQRIVVVLITDGRGNQHLAQETRRDEVPNLARLLAEEPMCDFIVIDTEHKGNFLRADLALDLARRLEAEYYTVEALRAEYLAEMVQARMSG